MTDEPPRDSRAWDAWNTCREEIAKHGHIPRVGILRGINCEVCGRRTINSYPEGRKHAE